MLDRNPIDLTLAGLQPEVMRGAISILLDSPDYDAVISVVGSSGVAQPHLMADAIRDSLAHSTKPVLAYTQPHAPAAAQRINGSGGVAFSAPESCAGALKALALQGSYARQRPGQLGAAPLAESVALADLQPGPLDEARSAQSLQHGLPPLGYDTLVREGDWLPALDALLETLKLAQAPVQAALDELRQADAGQRKAWAIALLAGQLRAGARWRGALSWRCPAGGLDPLAAAQ